MEQSSLQEGKAEAQLLEELAKAMEKKMNERLHVSNSLNWKLKKKKSTSGSEISSKSKTVETWTQCNQMFTNSLLHQLVN